LNHSSRSSQKEQLKVWIPSSCIDSLRKHIVRKYPGFKRGLLSLEVENLINEGIANFRKVDQQLKEEEYAHTLLKKQSKKDSDDRDLLMLKGQVLTYLLEKGKLDDYDFPKDVAKKDVEEAIMCATGKTDVGRTVRNKLRLLIAKNLFQDGGTSIGKEKLITIPEQQSQENIEQLRQKYEQQKKQGEMHDLKQADEIIGRYLK
jgi:hypothetical protein